MDTEHPEVETAEPPGFFSSAREQKPLGFALGAPELAVHGRLGGMTALESPGQDAPERKNIPKYP